MKVAIPALLHSGWTNRNEMYTILFITVCSEMTVGVGPGVTNVRAEGGGGGTLSDCPVKVPCSQRV